MGLRSRGSWEKGQLEANRKVRGEKGMNKKEENWSREERRGEEEEGRFGGEGFPDEAQLNLPRSHDSLQPHRPGPHTHS